MRGSYLAILAATTTWAAACSVYDTSLLLKSGTTGSGGQVGASGGEGGEGGTDGTGGDAVGGSGAADGAAGGSGPCDVPSKTYPAFPTNVVTTGGNIEIVAAQYSINLGDAPSAPVVPTEYLKVGYDLDNLCSTSANFRQFGTRPQGAGTSCHLPDYGRGVIDGVGGIDNALGAVIQTVRDLTSNAFSSENYTNQLRQGSSNVIFRILGYNGEANDDQVRMEVFVAAPYSQLRDAGALPDWDGTDVWPIASDSVEDLDRTKPRFFDDRAYVSDFKIVASLTKAVLRLDVGLSTLGNVRLGMELAGAYNVCDIVNTTEGRWGKTLENCTLGGRWIVNELIKQLSHFPDPVRPGYRLCRDSQPYMGFRDNLCRLVDVYEDANAVNQTCNALSMGVEFDMRPANIGDVVIIEPEPPGCLDAVDPVHDSCANFGIPFNTGGRTGTGGRAGAGGAPGAGGTTGAGGAPDASIPDASATD